MLRRVLDWQLSLFDKGRRWARLRPFVSAVDAFCYEVPFNTTRAPHVRDAVDLKRWMVIVLLALLPAILMAIWNTGLQKMVYVSGSAPLMEEFRRASTSFHGYFAFVSQEGRIATILKEGALAFLPVMVISYAVGGLCEAIFACIRRHEIAEGFLVTGMLYPLILPPTIPYWMVALGVAAGVVIGKEVFGGTGMNILNPALTCRAFLFFTFPGKMTGDIWVGTNPTKVQQSLVQMNAQLPSVDGFSQATPLGLLNGALPEIKRIHVDAIASQIVDKVPTLETLQSQFATWNALGNHGATLGKLSLDQLKAFLTAPLSEGGLALLPDNFDAAYHFTSVTYGLGPFSDGNLFFGNMLGSMGETSVLACLLGAGLLLLTRVGSWRTMLAMALGAFVTASAFRLLGAHLGGGPEGAWHPAKFFVPAYRHLLMGGLAFGCVFMATDPVSSCTMKLSKWIYGALIGMVTILIRLINPAFPEGVMLAILFGNVFAPLIDYYVVRNYRSLRATA